MNPNSSGNMPMSRAEIILRYAVMVIALTLFAGAGIYLAARAAIGAIVSDPAEATAMTNLACLGTIAIGIVSACIVGASYMMTSRTLTAAIATNDGTRALLMSNANRADADADVRRAVAGVLQNPIAQNSYSSQSWRESETYTPGQLDAASYPLLPARRVVNVPVIMQNQKPVTTLRTTARDATNKPIDLQVDIEVIRKLMSLHPEPPTRANCQAAGIMSNVEQAEALQFLRAHGIVQPGEKGRPAAWVEGLSRDGLLEWLSQFESQPISSPIAR